MKQLFSSTKTEKVGRKKLETLGDKVGKRERIDGVLLVNQSLVHVAG
jgi:hypothetical protein